MLITSVDAATFDLLPQPSMHGSDCRTCTYWQGKPEGDKLAAKRALFEQGQLHGKLATGADGAPIGFVQYGPASSFPAYKRFRREFDAEILPDTWVMTCLMTHRDHRGQGVARALLRAVMEEASANGRTLEAMGMEEADWDHISVGPAKLYASEGFVELGRNRDQYGVNVLARLVPT